MFDILIKFIVLPFVVAFIFGLLYYSVWKAVHPTKQETKTTS